MWRRMRTGLILSLALMLGACASTPTWEGMSESEIAAWKAMDLTAESAQKFSRAGLSSDDVAAWREAGLTGTDAILAWSKTGWKPESAASWLERDFDLETASEWAKERFTAEEASVWMKSGFDLDQAMDNREKGLTPVR